MSRVAPSRLPRRVFFACIGVTVVLAVAAMIVTTLTGWTPPPASAGFFLPLYFAMLLAALSLSYALSGNTLIHHHRTGTVQRGSSPGLFWSLVVVQSLLAAVLLVVGFLAWSRWHG